MASDLRQTLRADLFRYRGQTGRRAFWSAYLREPGFRFTCYLRKTAHYSGRKRSFAVFAYLYNRVLYHLSPLPLPLRIRHLSHHPHRSRPLHRPLRRSGRQPPRGPGRQRQHRARRHHRRRQPRPAHRRTHPRRPRLGRRKCRPRRQHHRRSRRAHRPRSLRQLRRAPHGRRSRQPRQGHLQRRLHRLRQPHPRPRITSDTPRQPARRANLIPNEPAPRRTPPRPQGFRLHLQPLRPHRQRFTTI